MVMQCLLSPRPCITAVPAADVMLYIIGYVGAGAMLRSVSYFASPCYLYNGAESSHITKPNLQQNYNCG
jgi:hypothetical protein